MYNDTILKNYPCRNSCAIVPDLIQHSGCLDTDINKSVSPTAEEQPDEPDGPLPGSAGDEENKVSYSLSYSYWRQNILFRFFKAQHCLETSKESWKAVFIFTLPTFLLGLFFSALTKGLMATQAEKAKGLDFRIHSLDRHLIHTLKINKIDYFLVRYKRNYDKVRV